MKKRKLTITEIEPVNLTEKTVKEKLKIMNVEPGGKSNGNAESVYRSKILYAVVRNEKNELICSATLDYILAYYKKCTNYKTMFKKNEIFKARIKEQESIKS